MSFGSRWGPWRSILALSPVLIFMPWSAYKHHYTLPEPLTNLTNPETKHPQISEERILGIVSHLSKEIGYRTVGTYEHASADTWMLEAAEMVQRNCERIASYGRKLECEVWHQEGSGTHRFDMMGKRLYKAYVNLTNTVVRISDGTPEGKEHAVLVNAHLDSTLPSPGAADDALAVGVMLDTMRVLVETPEWSPKHSIIFLFNNAEESLQDGSHLFSTQHPIASTVRAVINLEAAGSTGRELLFQATSQQMIEAYSKVPRPYGTIFANDIFSSGVLLSDTDFRQFEEYLNVTGLDMAVVGNSYVYHMRKDTVENIEPGVAQHMAENTVALLRYLSAEGSPLPSLTEGYARPTTVFFAHLFDTFFIYSFTTAKLLYGALLLLSFGLVRLTFVEPAPALKNGNGFWKEQIKGSVAVLAGITGTLLVPNLVALLMKHGLGKGFSWFSQPLSPIGLYGPAALLGALLSQYLVGAVHEQSVYTSTLLLQALLAFAVQLAGIGSAAVFFLSALPIFIGWLVNPIFASSTSANLAAGRRISLVTYAIAQALPLLTGTMMLLGVLDVFVPLTGRIGGDAPAEHIIAVLVSSLGALTLPLLLPFAHRFGRRALLRGVILATLLTTVSVSLYAMRVPFDKMHQKRVFFLYTENITTHEHHLHISDSDGAPGFELLVKDIIKEFGADENQTAVALHMDDHNSDWDSLYPFSAFVTPYKIPILVEEDYISPWTKGADQPFEVIAIERGPSKFGPDTRNLTVVIKHPGLIWTVVAFDAHVLEWSLDSNPPNEYMRHHVKEASYYNTEIYSFDMVVKGSAPTLKAGSASTPVPASDSTDEESESSPEPEFEGGILVNFVGIQESGMWPGKMGVKEVGGVAMETFEVLDAWIEERTHGTVDALLLGCVGGITRV